MNILIADKFPANYIEKLKSLGHKVTFDPDLNGGTLARALIDVEVLVVRSTEVRKPVFESAKSLKLVIRAGAGVNTIDVKEAAAAGIAVANTPGMNAIAVAELVFGLILAIDRKIPENIEDLKKGVWNKKKYGKAQGLYGRIIGVWGVGNTGKEVVKRAKAFGMTVNAFDVMLSRETAIEMGVNFYNNPIDMARDSDIITIHIPLIKGGTYHLIDEKVFAVMKPGAILIDCSRGGIVDEAAMVKAMKEKGIRVGKDVYESEPESDNGEFHCECAGLSGFYGTHHIGASTEQAQEAVAQEVVRIIQTFAESGKVLHRVN
ncbi:MAG: hypothetical protein Kow0090_03710 [Myxococcota bacterium]